MLARIKNQILYLKVATIKPTKINRINSFKSPKFKNKSVAIGYLKDGNFYPKNLLNNFFV